MISYQILSETLLTRLNPYGFCHVDGQPQSSDDVACQAIIDQHQFSDAQADLIAAYTTAIQTRLEAEANAAGYDNIISACSYASVPNAFQSDGVSFLTWRSNVWSYCHNVLEQVNSGAVQPPTVAGLLAGIPSRQ